MSTYSGSGTSRSLSSGKDLVLDLRDLGGEICGSSLLITEGSSGLAFILKSKYAGIFLKRIPRGASGPRSAPDFGRR